MDNYDHQRVMGPGKESQMIGALVMFSGMALFAVVITVLDAIGRRQQRRKRAQPERSG